MVLEREREEEEERRARMSDPFSDESVRYSNVHPSMEVEREEEEEEEGMIFTTVASAFACMSEEGEVIVRD